MTPEIQEALWQYLLDHANVHKAPGKRPCWLITFSARDKRDFFRRLNARLSGTYHRYEPEEKDLNIRAAHVHYENHKLRRARKFAEKTWLGRILSNTQLYLTTKVLEFNPDV